MNRIKGKWVLITGATSGIGRASTQLFAEQGANLVLTGRRENRLNELREIIRETCTVDVQTHAFDVRDRKACKQCVETIEPEIDILLNNAGLASGKDPIHAADFEDWDKMIDTNIKGLLNMTRFVGERMKARNQGHIINIGSIAGHEAYPGGSVYCGTKHAVKAITQAAKMDFSDTKIRVSAISPGLVDTEFSLVRFHGNQEKAQDVYEKMQPLTANDIAEIILFTANRPPHVNIMDTIIFPVQQSSATIVSRK